MAEYRFNCSGCGRGLSAHSETFRLCPDCDTPNRIEHNRI